jgi:hypothetical protein
MIFLLQKMKINPAVADDGDIVDVNLGVCPDCQGWEWFVYLVGENHTPHVKCCKCGSVFHCPGGATTDSADQPQRVTPDELHRIDQIQPSDN